MDIQQIITDPTLSPEAKVILVTGEIEKVLSSATTEQVEIKLLCEDVQFLSYHAAFIPRVGELVRCRLVIGKGHLATLWKVKEVEHGVGTDRLWDVTVSLEPTDEQTKLHWKRYPKKVK